VSDPAGVPSYPLGHTDIELERLATEARLIDPITRQYLVEAGIEPGIPERARTLGNRHYRLVPSGSTDQLLVSPMVIRRAERAGGVPAVIASRQDCAMLAGGLFLGCAGGPLP